MLFGSNERGAGAMLGVAAGVLEVMLGGAGECCGVLGQSDVEWNHLFVFCSWATTCLYF
jgi:hypothetical protein